MFNFINKKLNKNTLLNVYSLLTLKFTNQKLITMKYFRSFFFAVVLVTVTGFAANAQAQTASKSISMDIVDLAVSQDNLSTLVAAVKAGGLVETLKSKGPFTVFAPTNEAFSALPAGTLESLLKPENKDQLVQILTYHVVSEKLMSTDLKEGMSVKTVQGGDVTLDISKDGVKVNDAKVINADVSASNGVVHVIDKVILPPIN
jgi:uncharacterized surface protein with fasciclin (FAS1) repeats